jgi:thioredoxin-related protein
MIENDDKMMMMMMKHVIFKFCHPLKKQQKRQTKERTKMHHP